MSHTIVFNFAALGFSHYYLGLEGALEACESARINAILQGTMAPLKVEEVAGLTLWDERVLGPATSPMEGQSHCGQTSGRMGYLT